MQLFGQTNIDFVRWRWHAIAASCLILLIGAWTIYTRGLPLGVEFSGGTIVILQFEETPNLERIRGAIPGGAQGAIVHTYGDPAQHQVMIRAPQVGEEIGGDLAATADAVVASLREAPVGNFQVIGTEIIGPVVGEQLRRQGTMATILAMLGILVYIALRFRFSFAVGAVVALIHDILVVLTFLAIFRYDLSLNVIAGILAITGYSVNDTIVIFDRVRENLRAMRKDNLAHIVNLSINQTLARTVITAATTTLAVLALFLFGGEVLRGFAFTMLVGVIVGTYSTVFIAAAIVLFWQGGVARTAAVPAAGAAVPRRTSRRARAS